MKELKDRILAEGKNLGGGILNVNSFLNHQVDCLLMVRIGQELAARFANHNPDKVLTAEISGIAPALEVGVALRVPVIFARKIKSVTMPEDSYERTVPSRTKGDMVQLIVAPNFLDEADRVLIIDDFLASGQTIEALASIVKESGAELGVSEWSSRKPSRKGGNGWHPLKCPSNPWPSSKAWKMIE